MSECTNGLAASLAEKLIATESAIDAALMQAADLAGFMPAVRLKARFPAEVGQAAIEQALVTMHTLGQARRTIVETHKALEQVRKDVGLRERNYGAFIPKPGRSSENGTLSIVPTERAA